MGRQLQSCAADMDLHVRDVKISEDFRSLAPHAPMPWSYSERGYVYDASGTEVCRTTPVLAVVIVVAVNTCAGFRSVPPSDV